MTDQDPTGSTPPPSPEPGGAEPPPPTGQPGEQAGAPTNDERNLALLIHVLGFFTSIIVPLIIWLLKKESSKFLDHHGKQAINFQITVLIGYLIGSVTTFIFIGCVIIPAVLIIDIVFCIIAALAASKGEWYRYPIAIPLLR
jgi:uncharacterized protein